MVARLAQVAGRLEEELAGWRRRCLKAEEDLEETRARIPQLGDVNQVRARLAEVEAENARLQERIGHAREQLEQLRTRLRFVGEQVG